jgi:predicted RNase H-like nuclease (RuvC/YqgF family)
MVIATVLSFGATLGLTLMLKGPAVVEAKPVEVQQSSSTGQVDISDQSDIRFMTKNIDEGFSMTEKQLQSLIYDVREKIEEYENKERQLELREERIQVANEQLEKDVKELDELHMNLQATLASLKQQQANLEATVTRIDALEKENWQMIAKRYDKMDISYASKIIINMVKNNQLDDAVKILYYMSERPSGKLLGEIGNSEPEIASLLSNKLSRIKEERE